MKKYLFLAVISGMLFSCASAPAPPRDVGKHKMEASVQKYVAPTATAIDLAYVEVTEFVALSPAINAMVAPAVTVEKSRMPLVGHAIRLRDGSKNFLINCKIISTSGHRLINLHVDPGLVA